MADVYHSDIEIRISDEFLYLSEGASMLRTLLNTDEAGDLYKVFLLFKRHFEILFLLSSDTKDINKQIIDSVKVWIEKKHSTLYADDAKEGLELFYKYKSELFRLNVLEA